MVASSADGLLVHPFMTESYARDVMHPVITDALAASGRTSADLTIGIDAIVCTGRDEVEQEAADTGTRWLLAFYGSTPSYKPVLDHIGYGDLQPDLNRLSKEGRWDEMPALIEEPLLDHLALRGTPKEVAHALVHRYDGVADRIGFYLPYAHDDDLIGEVMDHVGTGR
jgi:alkanesulfonate monooxygenase SsuD/methylene tetrahydromethanopterin reductase-like flavin-dependent oxidoreductase (luciferase family)